MVSSITKISHPPHVTQNVLHPLKTLIREYHEISHDAVARIRMSHRCSRGRSFRSIPYFEFQPRRDEWRLYFNCFPEIMSRCQWISNGEICVKRFNKSGICGLLRSHLSSALLLSAVDEDTDAHQR